jgi:hypothetical protein
LKIFLSHSTLDRDIAATLKQLIKDLFGEGVTVEYSSDQEAGGGIPPGAEWVPWINQKIKAANQTYVLLTPNSINRPWVLWESGAAAGVALAGSKPSAVVPITFGLANSEIPSPLDDRQTVKGDTDQAGGILRLLQNLNQEVAVPLGEKAFESRTAKYVPDFLATIKKSLEASKPLESLLGSIPQIFSASILRGFWVTSYQFTSANNKRYHSEIVQLTDESTRRLRGETCPSPAPRTEDRKRPFYNKIDFEIANRHLVGHWKNISDTRYFGTIHLAVLPGENMLEGHYTAFESDVSVSPGPWRWVRIDPKTVQENSLPPLVLQEPAKIWERLDSQKADDDPISLKDIVEGP